MNKVGRIIFPEFSGIKCNMMPFIQGDSSSIPDEYKNYANIIENTFIRKGEIGFLTIDEKFVEAGKSQRGFNSLGINRNVHIEVGKYMNEGRDFHHILDDNFDELVVSNSEQVSGYLKMHLESKKDMRMLLDYPRIDVVNNLIHISFNKEEQKYRVNMFWDIVKDRGEFTGNNYPLWITNPNGYIKIINDKAVNLDKKDLLRKKFRSVWHKILLTKHKSGDRKFIFKFNNSKELNSFA